MTIKSIMIYFTKQLKKIFINITKYLSEYFYDTKYINRNNLKKKSKYN